MITQEALKKYLHYNSETGVFVRRVTCGYRGCHKKGVNLGSVSKAGYVEVRVGGILYLAHRLAWFYEYGYFPEYQIDHRNGNRQDNRISNLRHVTKFCNMQNCAMSSRNKSGFPGVSWSKLQGSWVAQVGFRGKTYNLGFYIDPLEAALARFTFEQQCDGWKCNHRSELTKAIKNYWPDFPF